MEAGLRAGPLDNRSDMLDGKLKQAVEAYFTDRRLVRSSGDATDERSLYVPLANLLNAVSGTLRPKVFCVQDLADQGAGHADFGLYTTGQAQKDSSESGQSPACGGAEAKVVAETLGGKRRRNLLPGDP